MIKTRHSSVSLKSLSVLVVFVALLLGDGCSQGGGGGGSSDAEKPNQKPNTSTEDQGDGSSTGDTTDPKTDTHKDGDKIEQELIAKRDSCTARGDDYRWAAGNCEAIANTKVAGTLSAEPRPIWEASTSTCDLVRTPEGDRYVNCAGVDVTIPMPTLEGAPSLNSVKVLFECEALAPLKATLGIGVSYYNNAWGPRTGSQIYRSHVLAGEKPAIHLVFEATGVDEPVKAGCKIALQENSAQAEAPPPELGDMEYKFEGSDETGQLCSTGKQSFASIQSFCVGIQSPVVNKNNCALQERITHFERKCAPAGYTFNESLRCAVGLYPGNQTISSSEFPEQGRIAKEEYCVGRRSEGSDLGRFGQHAIYMGDNVRISVEMNFVPRLFSDATHKSAFKFELIAPTTEDRIAEPVEIVDPIFARSSGFTRDQRFQYVAVCRKTWSCDP